MKPDKFIDAMGQISDKHIEEFLAEKKKRRLPAFVKIASAAASIAVVLSASLLIWYHGSGDTVVTPPTPGTTAATEAPATDNGGEDIPPTTHKDFKIVSVAANKKEGNFIASDTSFVVKTEHGTEEDVRTHLYISTAPEYKVIKTAEETFEVFLSGAIADNSVVSLSYVRDGIIDESWAFQTEGKLSLVGSYPSDGNTTTDINSVIELEFSYSSTEGIEDAVRFEPHIEGEWEHVGRVWRFTPAAPLEKDTRYKIYVGNSITAEGKTIKKAEIVEFATYEDSMPFSCTPGIITLDGINSYLPEKNITVRFSCYGEFDIGRVSIEKFASYEDMLAFSRKDTGFSSEEIGDTRFTLENVSGLYSEKTYNMILEKTLPQGYYAARVYKDDGEHLFDWIIQVHPLSVYAAVTERDVLVWVAEDGVLAEGINVDLDGVKAATDKEGTVLLKDCTAGDNGIETLLVGDADAPFVVGTPNFTHSNYPSGYIYTDKPRYKNTDTIKVWGVVPLDLFYDEPNGKFTVRLDDEYEMDVTPDSNGIFSCEIDIVNHSDVGSSIALQYEGVSIAYKIVDIYDYYLKNYEITTTFDKYYFEEGEDIEFTIRVSHVSGIDVAGKKLKVRLNGIKELVATTGADGTATVTVKYDDYKNTDYRYTNSTYAARNINVTVSFAESADTDDSTSLDTIHLLDAPIEMHEKEENNTYSAEFKYVSVDKLNGVPDSDGKTVKDLMGNTFVCGKAYDTEVTLGTRLIKYQREITEHKYDPRTKTNIPVYGNESKAIVLKHKSTTLATKDGKITIDLNNYDLPAATDTERYMWIFDITLSLPNGYTMQYNVYPLSNYYESNKQGFTDFGPGNSSNPLALPHDYFVFNYRLSHSNDNLWNEGDVIPVTFTHHDGSIPESGRLMYFIYAQGIRRLEYTNDTKFDIVVDKDTFPKAEVGAVYFKDGVFHRVSGTNIGYNADQRAIDIGIDTDKENYKPGDEVTLTVTLNRSDGVLQGAGVNISVVNEAVFIDADSTNITSALLIGAGIKDYFYSSYRDYSLINNVGGWGGGGPRYSDFGDTVYFGTAVSDENGRCTVTFKLPEGRVTSYRVTVNAANRELYSGSATHNVDAESDFFIQPGEVKFTKSTDELVIPASLLTKVSDTGIMTFRLNELGLELKVEAESGRLSFANFGQIPAGDYTVTISAVSNTNESLTHKITVPVTVKNSTLEVAEEHTVDLSEDLALTPSKSPVSLKFFSEEAGRYVRYMDHIDDMKSERYDTVLAGVYASTLREKLYGVKGQNPVSPYNYFAKSGPGYYNIALLKDGDADAVLTAMYMYMTGRSNLYGHYASGSELKPEPEVQIAETLLIAAAAGDPVLVDLHHIKDKLSDDPYVHAVVSLALSISGDTASAKQVLLPMGDNPTEGDRGLYCIALAFVDRDAAAEEIDRLIKECPDELYLGIAASVYMKTGETQIGDTDSVTVICKGKETNITVGGLTAENLILTVDEGESISFKDATEGMHVKYSCITTFTPKEDEFNVRGLEIELPEELAVSESGVIKVKLGELDRKGFVKIALPTCLRYDSPYFGISSNIVTVYASEDHDFVEIPVTATVPGSYILEPVIYSVNGVKYYSDATELTVSNGSCHTAIDPIKVG